MLMIDGEIKSLILTGLDDRNIQENVAFNGSESTVLFVSCCSLHDFFFSLFSFCFLLCFKNKKPSVFVSTYEEGIKRVLEGNYAFLMESTMLDYAVQRDCNLTQIGGNF